MCGIAGICGDVDMQVRDVLKKISHRGPDGYGEWKNEYFELGHLRLSIIDLSVSANQPMSDDQTGNQIIYNGEIYNYKELRSELASGYHFKTNSDTEAILAAYRKWGADCFSHLRGMFSIAIYDNKKNSILAARDRIGIKPFYYRKLQDGLVFSSEIKGLLNLDGVHDQMNEIKLAEFLCARQLDCNHETLFKDIFQLQPGSYVWINSRGEMSPIVKYWDFPRHGNKKFDTKKHGPEFLECFSECINLHLRSDVPVGAFVSGGLDSSSVASLVLDDTSLDRLHTFSAILPVRNEENKLIEEITCHPKAEKHEFYLDGSGFFDEISNVIYHNDEPIQDGSMYSHYKLCQMAATTGIKVLLSGSGGDELLGGYASHVHAYLGTEMKNLNFRKYFNQVKNISANSGYTRTDLIKKSLQELLPFDIRIKYKHDQFKKAAAHTYLSDYTQKLPYYYYRDSDPWTSNYINNYKSWTVPPYLHYEDRNSMAFGSEIRVPFYDHVLIEYVSEFTPDSLINGRSKSILRDSLRGKVPEKILNQKGKYGFPSPIDTLLRDRSQTFPFYQNAISDVPFLDIKKSMKLGEDFFHGKADFGIFWRTLSLSIWYKRFFQA